MLRSKACPRCSGDLHRIEDLDASYFSCIQCGWMTYQQPPVMPKARRAARTTRTAASGRTDLARSR